MIVPVRSSSDKIIGTIDVESARTEAFGQPEILFVEHCAQVLAPLWLSGLK
jgi:putative methionine-R-sulfoxide reductase with GAF domain